MNAWAAFLATVIAGALGVVLFFAGTWVLVRLFSA
jgi:hypothetical protein